MRISSRHGEIGNTYSIIDQYSVRMETVQVEVALRCSIGIDFVLHETLGLLVGNSVNLAK